MLGRALAFVKEAPDAPRIEDPAVVERTYRLKRNLVLTASMVGYASFYFCRNSLPAARKLMMEDLHLSDAQLGDLAAWLPLSYGVGKLSAGLVADRASPRAFFALGIVLSAATCIAFGLSSSFIVMSFLWGLNGAFQSLGAPASAKTMAVWFGAAERGTKTAIWNISHQAGGGFVLAFAGFCTARWGWRGGMIGPAFVALAGLVVVFPFIYDRPTSEGLPPIEDWKKESLPAEDEARGLTTGQLLLQKVLLNPRVWNVALASFFTHVVRYGALGYVPNYLANVRGLNPEASGYKSSLLELSGIPSVLLCGWLSDRFGSRRAPIACVSLVCLGASTWLLYRVPPASPTLDLVALAAIGFFTYGPQLLLAGVAPVDVSSRRVAAAAVGFTGFMSYLGAWLGTKMTGRLLGPKALGHVRWETSFDFWAGAALVGALLCLPLWKQAAGGKKT